MNFNPKRLITNVKKIDDFLSDMKILIDKRRDKKISLLERIKLFYYNKIKGPLLRKKYNREFSTDINYLMHNPENFLEMITYIMNTIISISPKDPDRLNQYIQKLFDKAKVPNPISLSYILSEDNTKLVSYKITLHYLPKQHMDIIKYYPDNVFHCEINTNLMKGICNVETIILNTDDIYLKETTVKHYKHIALQPDGKIKNSSGVYTKDVNQEDIDEFKSIIISILIPFTYILDSIVSMKFFIASK